MRGIKHNLYAFTYYAAGGNLMKRYAPFPHHPVSDDATTLPKIFYYNPNSGEMPRVDPNG
jgi:hypothetical protein